MSKKQQQPRPVYICPKCSMEWVHDTDPICIICKVVGIPQNKGAEKTVRKLNKEE